MKTALISLILLLAAPAARAASSDYWETTGLNFSYLENKILDHCYDSPLDLFACYQTVNEAAHLANAEAAFATPEEALQDPVYYSRPLNEFGPITLFSVTSFYASGSDYFAAEWEKRIVGARLRAVRSLLRSANVTRVDFSALLEALKPLLTDEAGVAGKAYNAYLKTIYDPHTYVVPRRFVEESEKNVDHHGYGLGVKYKKVRGEPRILEVAADSSSYRAGLRPNDIFIQINDVKVSQMALGEISALIQKSESFQIKAKRGQKILDFSVTKAPFTFENVETQMLSDGDHPVGYLRLRTFNDNDVCDKVQRALGDLLQQKATAFILDLRGNTGGHLDGAVCVASLFLGKKVITQLQNQKTGAVEIAVGEREALTSLPLVTLVDGVTMSAPELISVAFQDYLRAWVLGDYTFGKGTSQTRSELNAELYLFQTKTIYFGPSGRSIQAVGVHPNFIVDPFPGATDEDRFSPHESDLQMHFSLNSRVGWREPQPALAAKIEECRTQNQHAEKLFARRENADYRLLVAEDILDCEATFAPKP